MNGDLTLHLLATPGAVPLARHAVREHLGCHTAELCVSELLTNALTHLGEGTPVTLRVTGRAARTRVELTDPEPHARPVRRHPADGDESGRGLALLDALAVQWGVIQGPGSKTVWCELELDPGHSRHGRVALITGG
ncbi:ATP-binding protein [Streptomyces sp. NPDC051546]|uniref:ATP-binding protein n=1 Tax=Streptomyces sp. NPDC051546 TaxID=3365655 RepID=UPI0037BDB290